MSKQSTVIITLDEDLLTFFYGFITSINKREGFIYDRSLTEIETHLKTVYDYTDIDIETMCKALQNQIQVFEENPEKVEGVKKAIKPLLNPEAT